MQPWMKEKGKIKRALTHDPISFVQQAERRRIERLKNIKGTVKSGMKHSSDFIRKQVEHRHRELLKSKKINDTNKHNVEEFQFDKGSFENTEKTKHGLKLTRCPDVEKERPRIVDKTNTGKENVDHSGLQRPNINKMSHKSMVPRKNSTTKSTVAHDRIFIPAGKNTRVTLGQAKEKKEKKEKLEKISFSKVKKHTTKIPKKESKIFDAKFQRGVNLDCLEKEKQEAIALLNEIDKDFGCFGSEDEKDIPSLDRMTIDTKKAPTNLSPMSRLSDNSNIEEINKHWRSDSESSSDGHRHRDRVQPITFTLESFFPSNACE